MGSHAPAVAGKPDPKKGPYQATPWNIQLSATDTTGFTHVKKLEQRSADRASDLVMNNHSKFHTFHDEIVGFHNHISHHVLTLWALGATPDEMQVAYDFNKPFQLLTYYNDPSVNIKLRDPEFFRQGLGNFELYGDYVRFFQAEVAAKGVPTVLNEYLFKGDSLAEDLLARLFSGFLHPLINLGFALEFQQPFLAAECLASTCMHPPYPAEFLTATERHVESNGRPRSLPILSIVEGVRLDPVVATAVGPEDGNNRIADALLKRALKELIPYLSHFQVERTEEDLARKTAEILQASAYICGAAQHPRKVEALDFVMLHSLTAAVFFPTIIRQEWISIETRARLLEWKGRSDLITYAALGCPQLYPERITGYRPKKAATGWPDVVQRARVYQDDGHACKVIRALMCAENICQPFEGEEGFPLKKADFLTLAHMTMDSVERMLDPNWVRQTEKVKQMSAQGRGQHSQVSAIMLRWSPDNQIHAYCRSVSKLNRLHPEITQHRQVKVWEGSLEDVSFLSECIRGTRAVFMVVAIPDNMPYCTIAQDCTNAVLNALKKLQAEGCQSLPKLIVLSSASLEDSLCADVPPFIHRVLNIAAGNLYSDLAKAEKILRAEKHWVSTTFVKPGGLVHDVQRGHTLSTTTAKTPVSFLDVAAGMVEVANVDDRRYDMMNVSVNAIEDGTAFPWKGVYYVMTGLLFHFFPWTYKYFGDCTMPKPKKDL
ncbi:hypothetical protein BDV33DRAFT_231532 [Aspergillus novoparasiticus]|uniref:NAD(P)-binding domain-containing protein n=1 Tax=Aspergillus novoparasiticus TaxID=986946 RepID=A0A5N6EQ84_9EURO|nr:hypothetical protein BDV33DRAFT_231532 [Aspergillus novoparasiticus]